MKVTKRLLQFVGVLLFIAGAWFWLRPVSFFNNVIYLREALSGTQSRTVQVGGHRVHYLVQGPANGPVVVLVHGLGGRAEDWWLDQAKYLSKAGYRVYMPDLLGYGRSEQPADFSYSVSDETTVVLGFMDALNLKQVDLGGWSMGGWIVQRLASQHPERVRRLILFDAAGIFEKPTWDTRIFTPSNPQEFEQINALLTPHPYHLPNFMVQDILRHTRQNEWVIHRAFQSMQDGRDATDNLLATLQMPVLIVWGAEDHITPLHQGEKMHQLIPHSQMLVLPDCGHQAPAFCADQIGPTVVDFVKR
jgi:pimeloyl-ACP methyl ester carboxylesterase